MSRQLCHRATTHPFICSRLGERKERVGEGGLFLCRRMKKTSRSRFGSWWRLNARRGASVTKHIFIHPAFLPILLVASIHLFICERLFSHSMPPPPQSFLLTDGGRSTLSQLGDSDFHATSPPSPQARGYKKPKPPITPRCGIGLKDPRFGQRSDHHLRRNQQHLEWFYFLCAPFLVLFCSGSSMSVSVSGAGASPSVKTCVGRGGGGGSSWRIITTATLLYAFSLFTVLPCLIMFKQHCTGLWQRREPSCASLTRLDGSQTHDIIPSDDNQPVLNLVLLAGKGWFSFPRRCVWTQGLKAPLSEVQGTWNASRPPHI